MFTKSLKAIALGAAVSLPMLLQAHASQAAEVTIKIHHFVSTKAPIHKVLLKPWAKAVEKDSGGRIKVQIYPAMQLGGKPPQLFDQVRDGVVDAAFIIPGYTPGRFPITEVFEMPFVAQNAASTSPAVWEFYQKYLKDEFKQVHPLVLYTHAGGSIHSKKPIKTMADFKGMKIRTPTRSATSVLKNLGAVPIGMPVPAAPQALSKGVIDGAILPFEVTLPFKIHQLVK